MPLNNQQVQTYDSSKDIDKPFPRRRKINDQTDKGIWGSKKDIDFLDGRFACMLLYKNTLREQIKEFNKNGGNGDARWRESHSNS